MTHVAIVGAGISGLTLAHRLVRSGGGRVRVTLLESRDRVGGVIRSERAEGYLCEWGPGGFLDRAPDTQALIDELGIRDRLAPSSDRARRRFICRGGRLRDVPTGPGAFLTGDLLSVRGRLRVALEPFPRAGSAEDESIHAFAARRIGREAADVLVDAMTTGVFGGSSRDLSMKACFPQLWQMEREHGSLVRGMMRARRSSSASSGGSAPFGRLMSFSGGVEDLAAALGREVAGVLRLNERVDGIERVSRDGRPAWTVRTSSGSLTADRLVLGTGAAAASRLVQGIDAELGALLGGIRTASMIVLCLGFDAAAADARLDGFGFLVPRGEPARILGAVWESSVFEGRAPAGHVLVRIMLGGGRDPDALALNDAEIVAIARRDLKAIRGITSEPAFVRLVRQVPGLPQYTLGHPERLARIDERLGHHDGLRLVGNSYHGVALNACISNARRLADTLLAEAR